MNHVTLPNYEGKTLSEARVWGARNKIDFVPTMVYSKDFPETQIISQDPAADKKIRKGSEVLVDVSQGPDPEERIVLPDFSNLTYDEAQMWVQQEKANNVSLILQYDSGIERFRHIKTEFRSPDVTPDNYLRKDVAIVYYSRGEEQFEKTSMCPTLPVKPSPKSIPGPVPTGSKSLSRNRPARRSIRLCHFSIGLQRNQNRTERRI